MKIIDRDGDGTVDYASTGKVLSKHQDLYDDAVFWLAIGSFIPKSEDE